MPIPFVFHSIWRGVDSLPYAYTALKVTAWICVTAALKYYFGGARNTSEKVMHGMVVMVTGGTSGVGAALVQSLASRGAQIILLTRHPPNDPFLVEYIEDLRGTTHNELIYAEQVDLSSLHSIRLFATKWVDNAPPRRLDMVILCAAVLTPRWTTSEPTIDGVEEEWAVNYLANFHLLSILSPAIRAQPPDRNVRILFSTCNSYIGATLDLTGTESRTLSGHSSYGRSKLALMTFAQAFQKHLSSYDRPDKQPNNTRVLIVDPGQCRTPGTRRWLTGGSLWALMLYLATWAFWWLVLKSSQQGAQSYLHAAMDAKYSGSQRSGTGPDKPAKVIKECGERDVLRSEVGDLDIAKKLWEFSEKQIERLEKAGAVKRALAKKEGEAAAKAKEGVGAKAADSTKSTTAEKKVDGKTSGSQPARARKNK